MKPRTNVKWLNLRKSLLTCCSASEVYKQSCPRPFKSLKNQETLSPKLLKKLKEQRYSYCLLSRYFALRHLRRLLTPFITKFYIHATAFLQKRPEVTSDFRLGVVWRGPNEARKDNNLIENISNSDSKSNKNRKTNSTVTSKQTIQNTDANEEQSTTR